MKILLTADAMGGVWTYALELARALEPHRVELALATMGDPLSEAQQRAAAELPNVEVFESRFRLEWMDDPWDDVAAAGDWLLGIERRWRPDLIHLNGYAHGALPWRAPVIVAGHSCVLSWWRVVRGEAAPPEWERYRREVTRGIRAADRVIAPSRAMLAALDRFYGPLPPGARVISNGRDPRCFRARRKEPFILSAGRLWDEAKNTGALDAIANRLPWPIYLAGEARHPNGSSARHGAVRPLGRLSPPDFAGWLARASIYALPARYEPFGLTPLEAALSGCALVLGDIPSLREVWGDAARFVDPGDLEGLAAALQRFIADPALREQFAARAGARALRYSPERMAAGHLAIYREVRRPSAVEVEVEDAACVS